MVTHRVVTIASGDAANSYSGLDHLQSELTFKIYHSIVFRQYSDHFKMFTASGRLQQTHQLFSPAPAFSCVPAMGIDRLRKLVWTAV